MSCFSNHELFFTLRRLLLASETWTVGLEDSAFTKGVGVVDVKQDSEVREVKHTLRRRPVYKSASR